MCFRDVFDIGGIDVSGIDTMSIAESLGRLYGPDLDDGLLPDFWIHCCIILRRSWVHGTYAVLQFWRFCGIHIDSLGSLWLTRKFRTSSFSTQKFKFTKSHFDSKHNFRSEGGSTEAWLPRDHNEGWPQRLKSGRHSSFGP